jgi:hypothetical protein
MSYSKFLDAAGEYAEWRSKNNLPKLHYEKVFEVTRDAWIKEGRFKELISFILENWDSGNCDDFIAPLIPVLIQQKDTNQFKRLWKGIIRYRVDRLWYYTNIDYDWEELEAINISNFNMYKTESYTDQKRVAAFQRKFSLAAIDNYIDSLQHLNDQKEIERLLIIRNNVYLLQKPKPKKTTDRRKMDDKLFWELIDNSRSISQDQYEFLEKLKEQLEAFHPVQIRRFDKIFWDRFNEINLWALWALAYIVRRGCGDDEFDYFKAWVISKGQKAYENIKTLNSNNLLNLFDEDPQLEEFSYLAEQVYESKTNEIMKPNRIKQQKIKGTRWDENNLNSQFPTLCELFKFNVST